MMSDDEDDDFLFDADEDDPGTMRPPGLFLLMPVPNSEMLNTFEERYRMKEKAPVAFVDVDQETGREWLANPETFARAMGLAPGVLPDMAAVDAWAARIKPMEWAW